MTTLSVVMRLASWAEFQFFVRRVVIVGGICAASYAAAWVLSKLSGLEGSRLVTDGALPFMAHMESAGGLIVDFLILYAQAWLYGFPTFSGGLLGVVWFAVWFVVFSVKTWLLIFVSVFVIAPTNIACEFYRRFFESAVATAIVDGDRVVAASGISPGISNTQAARQMAPPPQMYQGIEPEHMGAAPTTAQDKARSLLA